MAEPNTPDVSGPDRGIDRADPPLVIDAALADRLYDLAVAALERAPDAARRLMAEVERASLLPTDRMPADVVTIGSEVTFVDNRSCLERTVILDFPANADYSARRVSVLTPIGAALIGLRKGDSIDWDTRSGLSCRLTVIRVRQPDPAPGDCR